MPNSRVIYGDTRDNIENLASDYIATLESSYDPIMLDAYLRGLWVSMNGNRFYYAYDPKRNDKADLTQHHGAEVHVSLDFNVSPMVATLWNVLTVINRDGVPLLLPNGMPMKKARAFYQIVIEDGADTHKMSEALSAHDLHPDSTTIYPDPAGNARTTASKNAKGDIQVLRDCGWYKIQVKSAAPRFRVRQLAVNNLLAKGLLEINPTECKALKKDLEAVEQDKATFEKI